MEAITSEILSTINSPIKSDKTKELGQEDFIELMITQLRNQDPFEPLQSGEFIGQLAQFGTVSGIGELKGIVSDLASALVSNQSLQAANLIGKNALIPSDSIQLEDGVPFRGALSANATSSNVNISIFDSSGNLVNTLPLGVVSPGLNEFQWNGTDASGNTVTPGNYFFSAVGTQGGDGVAFDTYAYKEIQSISLGESTSSIFLNIADGTELKISEVLKIQ